MLKAPVHEKIDLGFQVNAWMDWSFVSNGSIALEPQTIDVFLALSKECKPMGDPKHV